MLMEKITTVFDERQQHDSKSGSIRNLLIGVSLQEVYVVSRVKRYKILIASIDLMLSNPKFICA